MLPIFTDCGDIRNLPSFVTENKLLEVRYSYYADHTALHIARTVER